MPIRFPALAAAALAATTLLPAPLAGQKPEAEFAGIVKTYLSMSLPTDWDSLAKLPNSKWAATVTSLKNCLPNGDCYAYQGSVTVGGRNLTVAATGARTMVVNLLFRNMSAPIGEPAVLAALKQAGLSADLARCPIKSGAGGTNWYRVRGTGITSGYLSFQPAGPGRPNEGYVLSYGDELPALQPAQLALYSEQCAPGAERKPVSTLKPHEALAQTVVGLLAGAGTATYDWKTLASLPTEITWTEGGPKPTNLSFKGDPNPVSQSGVVSYGGRKFSVLASGTPAAVKTLYFDEGGLHPKGEHMLGVVYEKGIAVKLVRCGPVYTESTNNWYSLTSAKTRPAMILQSIRYDGNQVQDSYAVRLDGTLPARDPRDRNPGTAGC